MIRILIAEDSEVVTALDGLSSPGAPFDVWTFDVSSDYRGADPDATDATDSLELLLDIHLIAEINDEDFSIDLGEEGASLGVSIGSDIEVDASIDAEFSIGMATGGSGEVFLVPDDGAELREDLALEVFGAFGRGLEVELLRLLDEGIDDKGLLAFGDAPADELDGLPPAAAVDPARAHGLAPGRHLGRGYGRPRPPDGVVGAPPLHDRSPPQRPSGRSSRHRRR